VVRAGGGDALAPGIHTKLLSLTLPDVKRFVLNNEWLLYFPYAAGLVAIAGRTVGMMVLDLRVVRPDHGRVGIAQSIWRYSLALLFLPWVFGWFRRLQLHDRLSKSRLIGGRTGLS